MGKFKEEYDPTEDKSIHLMTSHTDGAGLISSYEYGEYGPQGKVIRNTTNLGEEWRFAYFPTYTTVTDVLGRTEHYYFDEHRELTKQVFADGGAVEFERGGLGRVLSRTDRAGETTYFEYTPLDLLFYIIASMLDFLYPQKNL